jgi:hypothetical protein
MLLLSLRFHLSAGCASGGERLYTMWSRDWIGDRVGIIARQKKALDAALDGS